jgi:hypothetical protein
LLVASPARVSFWAAMIGDAGNIHLERGPGHPSAVTDLAWIFRARAETRATFWNGNG